MKKFYASGLLLAALTALPASAQVEVNKFPALGAPMKAAQVQAPLKVQAPLAIDDKSKGVTIYAGETSDASKQRGWVKFNSNDAYYSTEKVRIYFPKEDDQIRGQRFGAYNTADKKYYSMFTRIYTFWEYPDFYAATDVKTGEVTDSIKVWKTWQSTPWIDDTKADKSDLPGYYDMAYNPADGLMYVLGANYETDGRAYTELFTIDNEGNFEDVTTLDAIYINFTFDYDGTMYAVKNTAGDDDVTATGCALVKFNQDFEPESEVALKKDGNDLIMGSYGSLAFDYSTGDLYWNVVTYPYGYAYIHRVPTDMKNGNLEYMSGVMTGTQVNGMYIPYLTADSRTAAGRVTSIDAQPAVDGAKSATVKWTNPTLAWNKSELSDLAEVLVYRKKAGKPAAETTAQIVSADQSELIATVDAKGKKGEKMEWVDNNPQNGINTYYVVPCRQSGELGVPDSVRCYVGVGDVPAKVSDVQIAKLSDSSVKLSWKAPEYGHNNGYINADELRYTVTRKPDNKVVATDIAETEFTDNNIVEDNMYYYSIQASTKAGKGDTYTTEKVRAGVGVVIPANFVLDNQDECDRWSQETNGASYEYTGPEDYQGFLLRTGSSGVNNWLYSPAIRMEKGKTYRFSYAVRCDYLKTEYNFYSHITTGTSKNTSVATLRSEEGLWSDLNYTVRQYEDTYTCTEDGLYHFAFNVDTESSDVYHFQYLKVTEVFDNNLAAQTITTGSSATADQENKATITVRNFGKKDVAENSYILRMYCDTGHGLTQVGFQKWVPAIKANETAEVNMWFTPRFEGTYEFIAKVELQGDQDATDDFSARKTLNVNSDGSLPWTNVVTNSETEGQDTHCPFQSYSTYDASSSLYLSEEIAAPAGAKIMRIGYDYNGQGWSKRSEDQNVKIYMENTREREVVSSPIETNNMTLVFDGTCTFEPGDNQLSFDLDTPFEYDNTKSLRIALFREGAIEGMFCNLFRVFNVGSDNSPRSLSYSEGTPYTGTSLYAENPVPVLYMAFDKYTGISNVNSDKAVDNAPVYNINGQYVGNSTKLLKKGVYIQNGKKIVVK